MLNHIKYFTFIIVLGYLIEKSIAAIDETYEQYIARIEYHDTPMTWADANKTCVSEGTYLVTPYAGFDDLYLGKKAPNTALWLGLSKPIDYWAAYFNGKRVNGQYTHWGKNQPDGWKNLCIEKAADGFWYDGSCTPKKSFFCYRKPKILMSSVAMFYSDAIKSCQKLWTAKSWWDIKYAASLANGKQFWTGSEMIVGSNGRYTPYGVVSKLAYGVKGKFGCTYSNSADTLDAGTCNSNKIFFCEIIPPTQRPTNKPTNKPTRNPTNNPTQKPTNKPTNNPTNNPIQYPTPDIYQVPVILRSIANITVEVDKFVPYKIPVDTLFDPKKYYGQITWSIEESFKTTSNSPIVYVADGTVPYVYVIMPPADLIGIHWFLIKATNPSGRFGSYPIAINVIPKKNLR